LQADVLARDIHWQGFHDIAGPAIGGCPDGSTTTIFVPGDSTACACGCPTTANRASAIQQAATWLQTLRDRGEPVSGTVRGLATLEQGSPGGTPSPWPLSRAMTAIAGLIVPENSMTMATSGAAFPDMADAAALRALRSAALSANANATWIRMQNDTDPQIYALYVRDELSSDVEAAFTAFVK
jgi:hypothetical protein